MEGRRDSSPRRRLSDWRRLGRGRRRRQASFPQQGRVARGRLPCRRGDCRCGAVWAAGSARSRGRRRQQGSPAASAASSPRCRSRRRPRRWKASSSFAGNAARNRRRGAVSAAGDSIAAAASMQGRQPAATRVDVPGAGHVARRVHHRCQERRWNSPPRRRLGGRRRPGCAVGASIAAASLRRRSRSRPRRQKTPSSLPGTSPGIAAPASSWRSGGARAAFDAYNGRQQHQASLPQPEASPEPVGD